ncbi:MAG: protein kinase domain-containing protein [Gemmatimonadota bacterium]
MTAAPYLLDRELGRGGMATVYLARDPKHGRQVAVKVLHPELAVLLGTERFLREIRVIATLQHPHIVGLIDSGVFGADDGELAGRPYYVMPYVAGESLRDRLEREGQLPVGDALRIAGEVAAALDYAHRHGVIHRDIKPENILLAEGSALVTDFGIALAVEQAGGARMTQTGLSLGTPSYMSPEQAMGERTITARSDIYALGAVTYEMLAGEPPFTGPTVQAVVARVLSEAPRPIRATRPAVRPEVEAAIMRALERLPADRFGSAAEFSAALSAAPGTMGAAAPVPAGRSRIVTFLPWAALLLGALMVGFAASRPRSAPVPPVYRFLVSLPPNAALTSNILSVMALSPDGTRLAYNGRDTTGLLRLYLRSMDDLEPVPVPGSENAAAPLFSPDGQWLAFRTGTRMVRVPLAGGPVEPICEVGGLVRPTWLGRDALVFADPRGLNICTPGNAATTILAADSGESFQLPHALPGDRIVLVGVTRTEGSRIVAVDVDDRSVTDLELPGSDPHYVDTGHLVYLGPDGLVRAIAFDLDALEVRGEPIVVDETLPVTYAMALVAIARNGTMMSAQNRTEYALELVDRTGRGERLLARTGEFAEPSVSPDGRHIAARLGDDIWLLDRNGGALTRLTFERAASRPVWSLDGREVAYVLQQRAEMDLRIITADGSGSARALPEPADQPWEVDFTADGHSLLVRTAGGPGSRDIWLVPRDSASAPTGLLTTAADELAPTLSRDGRWMAYVSNESGRAEVYVRAYPGMGGRYQVSLDGGTEPVWSRDGRELFYRSGSALLAAEIRPGSEFDVVRRTRLFDEPEFAIDLTHRFYDVTPDGRFVMVRDLEGGSLLNVTLNFFQNLADGKTPRQD